MKTMVEEKEDIRKRERLLGEKARRILKHQRLLAELQADRKQLINQKPRCVSDRLTFEESLSYARKLEQFESRLEDLDIRIQKVTRELKALEQQALRLLPVAGIPIEVSAYDDRRESIQRYSVHYIEEENTSDRNGHFRIEKV